MAPTTLVNFWTMEFNGAYAWHVNEYPGSAGGTTGDWDEILSTTNQRDGDQLGIFIKLSGFMEQSAKLF